MSLTWFICTYKRRIGTRHPTRYCAMDDFTDAIRLDSGDWAETEVLGNYAIVKVRASDATLSSIAGAAGFVRLPVDRLNDSLVALNGGQIRTLRDRLIDMGYDDAEIDSSLGVNLSVRTLGDLLRFAASRRRKPRYDSGQDQIVLDGEVQTCKSIDIVYSEVR